MTGDFIGNVVDVSHWQGDINVEKFLSNDPLAVVIKAGGIDAGGKLYTDSRLAENVGKFGGVIPTGFYFYFRPEFDGIAQADYFCEILEKYKGFVYLPPAVDVEVNSKNVAMWLFQNRLGDFIDRVEFIAGVTPIVYTRAFFWNANVGNPDWASSILCWIALYNETVPHPWRGLASGYKPLPWDDPFMWQYSADSNGLGRAYGVATSGIDLSKLCMTRDGFYAFIGWSQEDGGDRDGAGGLTTPFIGKLKDGFSSLRVRYSPHTTNTSNVVSHLTRSTRFMVHSIFAIGGDIWWLIQVADTHIVGWAAAKYQGVDYLVSL